jgi:hypothetical protein
MLGIIWSLFSEGFEIFFKIFHFAAGKKVVRDCLVIHQMLPKNHHGSFDQNG